MQRFFPFLTLALVLVSVSAEAGVVRGVVDGGRNLRNAPAVVYLSDAKGPLVKPATNPTMDQHNMTFIPHVLAIQSGTTVDFLNNDEVRHNVFSPDHEKYNLDTWPMHEIKQRTFDQQGVYTQLCNVHPEMEAFIVVLDTPYFAVTDQDGAFSIDNVPAGDYTVKVWHEKLRFAKQTVSITNESPVELAFATKTRRR